MRFRWFFWCVFGLVLLGLGVGSLPLRRDIAHAMQQQHLASPRLGEDVQRYVGQTTAVVALGGLRSLVAALWNFRAYLSFEKLDWLQLEKDYRIMTELSPLRPFYWEIGAWHLHTNAMTYYLEDALLSPRRKRQMAQVFYEKGMVFLRDGVKINPQSALLWVELGRILAKSEKPRDLCESYTCYLEASRVAKRTGKKAQWKRFALYTLARIPSRLEEAYAIARALYREKGNRTPTLICLLFCMENHFDIPAEERVQRLFSSPQERRKMLEAYWQQRQKGYPMDGVLSIIKVIENK